MLFSKFLNRHVFSKLCYIFLLFLFITKQNENILDDCIKIIYQLIITITFILKRYL